MKSLVQISSLLIGLVFFLSACEEVIDLPLKDAEPKLVIEGSVSNLRTRQSVMLSEMQPFDSENRRKVVSGAEVFLNENNGTWRQLSEAGAGNYVLDNLKGIPGNTYELLVNYQGQTYQAQSTMPDVVRIDSTGISINTFDGSRRTPLALYQDPGGVPNYYYFQLRINEEINTSLFLYNDKFNDGKYVLQNLDDFTLDLARGDSVVIELRNIDRDSFRFWEAVQSQNGTSASPGNPVSNITNGALGYFSAYAANSVYFIVD